MSANTHPVHADGGHDHQGGSSHGSFKGYMTGFILSVVLTAVPFWLVMGNVFTDSKVTAFAIIALAIVQIIVHMIYFLHMNTRSEGGWTMLALIFTVIVLFIAISGSLWVMHHLNTNMMPMSPADMRNMQ